MPPTDYTPPAEASDATRKSDRPAPDLIHEVEIEPPTSGRSVVTHDISNTALLKVVATALGIWFVIKVWPVIVLVSLSLMFVATFNPLVRRLQERLDRRWAIVLVVSGVVILAVACLAILIPPLVDQGMLLIKNAPTYSGEIHDALAKHHIRIDVKHSVAVMSAKLTTGFTHVLELATLIASSLTAVATVAILTIYLLIEGPSVATSLTRLLPREERLGARKLGAQIGEQVGGYMRGQLITSGLAGLVAFTVCLLVGVPQALALGALAAIADAIPIAGLLIALVPAVLMALVISSAKAGIVLAAYLVYHQLESHFIGPKVYGNTLGLSLSVIVISMLVGVELMGMLGAVLALPVAAAIPLIANYIREWHEERETPAADPQIPG